MACDVHVVERSCRFELGGCAAEFVLEDFGISHWHGGPGLLPPRVREPNEFPERSLSDADSHAPCRMGNVCRIAL